MLTRLQANATTTPKVRAEIQASSEPVAVLARRRLGPRRPPPDALGFVSLIGFALIVPATLLTAP